MFWRRKKKPDEPTREMYRPAWFRPGPPAEEPEVPPKNAPTWLNYEFVWNSVVLTLVDAWPDKINYLKFDGDPLVIIEEGAIQKEPKHGKVPKQGR